MYITFIVWQIIKYDRNTVSEISEIGKRNFKTSRLFCGKAKKLFPSILFYDKIATKYLVLRDLFKNN